MCTVRAYCFVTDFSMADALSFAFEVGCESFFGEILMHLCVHLHPEHVDVHVYTQVLVRVQV